VPGYVPAAICWSQLSRRGESKPSRQAGRGAENREANNDDVNNNNYYYYDDDDIEAGRT